MEGCLATGKLSRKGLSLASYNQRTLGRKEMGNDGEEEQGKDVIRHSDCRSISLHEVRKGVTDISFKKIIL